ncbi:glucosamine-6-phosphate deaminase [Rhizobium azooxidifex]|uniref:Glucosamine-6-phosphate deaminase n=1 Tax=Mycoplana azooxidifex TaxID=1636188 RepID=A0A7W6DBZ9_9HYPH|nr:glucosamine-6-phosphate isomerase [Mycoplana azooxidifex]MBB3979897.1 glucosamine-6-phosphate deaminase [Mycoplana azooxidifex]
MNTADHTRTALTWEQMMQMAPADLAKHGRIPLTIYDRPGDMFERLAREIADLIKTKNAVGEPTVLILPVGPKKHYPRLVEICNAERISWKNVTCFNMDEWMDWQCRLLPLDHPWSFKGYMHRNLYEKLDPDLRPLESNLFFPDPENMRFYSGWIAERGGADLCYGGFGYSGHIANNEPPFSRWWHVGLDDMRNSTTRILPLNDETLIAFSHRSAGGDTKMIPPMAVTIGMKDILSSKRLLLISDSGAWKQHTLRVLLMHEPTVDYPCTLAQEHPNCEVWVDRATAEPPSRIMNDS